MNDMVPSDLDARNRAIMIARLENRIAELDAMLDANKAWHGRMWRTPDVAPCLGRYIKR